MENVCKQKITFIFILLLLVANTMAQPKCKVEFYSTEQGLSHQRVTTILKDREGFMWFGSWDGINRFDGHAFVSYKSSPGDSSQLTSDRIDQIVEDQSGHLWIKGYDNQIYQFDKRTKRFLSISHFLRPDDKKKIAFQKILSASNGVVWLQSQNEGLFCISQTDLSKDNFYQYKQDGSSDFQLPSNTINFFHEDNEYQVWVGTSNGLCCLSRSGSGRFKKSKTRSPGVVAGSNFTAFDEDSSRVYFSTADGNLIIYNKGSKTFAVQKIATSRLNAIIRSKKKEVIYATTSNGEVISYNLTEQKTTSATCHAGEPLNTFYEDGTGSLWIEPDKLGAIRFDPSEHSFHLFSNKNEEGINYIGNRFRVLEDNNGTIWVNMKGGGFGYYNSEKGTVDYFLNTPDAASFHLPNIVFTIYYDKAGILWLTTNERDLIKIILQGNDFKQQVFVENEARRSQNEVRGILYDHKNRLWVGAKSGELYVFQNNQRITNLFDNEFPQGLGGVYSILQDRRRNIWLGTKGNGLYKASPIDKEETKYHLTHFAMDKADRNSLQCNDIYSLLEDKQGRIWIGSFDNGLTLIQDDQGTVRFSHTGAAFKNYPKGAFHKIRHMALDEDGKMWLGTTDGLLVMDAGDNHSFTYQFVSYSKIAGEKMSLGNNDIQFIFRDSKNRMWMATSGGGFCGVLGTNPFQSLQFRNYTTKDGLPNDYVLSCSEDKKGNIWIATENGLSKFNPESKTFRNYDSYDGLPKAGFSEASVNTHLLNGQFVFGTTKGILSFDPDRINANRISADIALTNLQINNQDAGPGADETILPSDINYASELTLKYNQNIISIDYAILDHRAGNRQAFAYRLIGFDSTWHDDRQLRRATYTNLPPGHYVFEVKSLSADLYSNTPYRKLAITIFPPPWKTWWAYLLYAIFIGVLLFFIRRYALAMIRLRNKIAVEQKLAALKLNFFTNVSHELRTPLTLIVNPLEQLAKKEKLSPEGASYVDVARKNAARMVRFINQLLDLRKVQSEKASLRISRIEVVTFVKKICDHFTEAARSKRIKLDIISDQKELFAWVDVEKMDVVVYNLIGNALKFTPEGRLIKITIRSIPEEQSFTLSFWDQGPGVEKDKLEEIFELFHEGDKPTNRELKGTGIGLALSREFVNLHDGKIWAANNEDGGLVVTVKLKLGSNHYKHGEASFIDTSTIEPVPERTIAQQLHPQPLYATSPEDQQSSLVLLVEDNDELRNFLKEQLSEFYRVETARNGKEGLEKAVHSIPDLIVSDIMMPVMDGIQMLDRVKNNVNTSHIPVVLLSAKYSIDSQIEGLKYGADYYITKPFHNEFLIASINNLLLQRKKIFGSLVEKKKIIDLGPEPIVVTSRDEIFLKEVIQVVENKMTDVDFNIDAVAESMAMSRTTFYKKFKSLTGHAPVEFVRDMRLQRAKQYLDAGGSNVSEVAYLAGFNNPKYFSTCFKEKYQVSPSDYQKAKAINSPG